MQNRKLPDIHRYYRTITEKPVNRELFKKIVDQFLSFIVDQITAGKRCKLPAFMGTIQIIGKQRPLSIDENGNIKGIVDWGETTKLWKNNPELKYKDYLYYENDHTDGYMYKITWSYRNARGKYKLLYVFKPFRNFKNIVSREIKSGKEYLTK